MIGPIRQLRARDIPFLLLILACGASVGGFLIDRPGVPHAAHGQFRRIDTERLRQRIRAGDLVLREADWYHPADEVEPVGRAEDPP